MDRKILLLVGILVIAGGAAFVYFDPLELDLLGLKPGKGVVQPAAKPGAAASAAQAPAAAPKPGVAPANAPAALAAAPSPVAVPVASTPAAPAAGPKTAVAPVQAKVPAGPSSTATPAATPPAAAPALTIQPPLKLAETIKIAKATQAGKPAAEKPMRPKDQDLRHCLELESAAAIAKCAGE